MSILLIGDLHLTDRPRDAYRFDIFDWIRERQIEFKPECTIFMGDITDKKDKHSAVLVNRIMDEFDKLDSFYVLMGNHDYIEQSNPFFKFLKPNFIYQTSVKGRKLFIPHFHNEQAFALACRDYGEIDYVFCHQTFDGAIAETGKRLTGFSNAHIDQIKPRLGVYAGDIHRPQRAANVVYVGAPYRIRFGDDFYPRCILLDDDGKPKNLYFDTVMKWNLKIRDARDITKDKNLAKGDQVKLTVEVAREEVVEWKTIKQQVHDAAIAKGLEVFGINVKVNTNTTEQIAITEMKSRKNSDVFATYCKRENLSSQIRKTGQSLLEVK